ncbi:hypothetical protein PBY51_003914 [Eleginops maclovinus]|uniref:Uncharacterized protein n=1 Tax=Eleginops maclovinus TaxID=56733 RepID=A0AAN7Y241_ELEMC|nr:hypothetical protein PBY51_003914 [Eleginops maclovinus]
MTAHRYTTETGASMHQRESDPVYQQAAAAVQMDGRYKVPRAVPGTVCQLCEKLRDNGTCEKDEYKAG